MSLFTLKYKFESITNPSLILYKYNKEQKQDLNISLASTLENKGCVEEVEHGECQGEDVHGLGGHQGAG